jgi:hypothetical protein
MTRDAPQHLSEAALTIPGHPILERAIAYADEVGNLLKTLAATQMPQRL